MFRQPHDQESLRSVDGAKMRFLSALLAAGFKERSGALGPYFERTKDHFTEQVRIKVTRVNELEPGDTIVVELDAQEQYAGE